MFVDCKPNGHLEIQPITKSGNNLSDSFQKKISFYNHAHSPLTSEQEVVETSWQLCWNQFLGLSACLGRGTQFELCCLSRCKASSQLSSSPSFASSQWIRIILQLHTWQSQGALVWSQLLTSQSFPTVRRPSWAAAPPPCPPSSRPPGASSSTTVPDSTSSPTRACSIQEFSYSWTRKS